MKHFFKAAAAVAGLARPPCSCWAWLKKTDRKGQAAPESLHARGPGKNTGAPCVKRNEKKQEIEKVLAEAFIFQLRFAIIKGANAKMCVKEETVC